VKDVIESLVRSGPFQGDDIQRFFDDTQELSLPVFGAADGTGILFRNVETDGAEGGFLF
jgi:hypothetical protein